MSDGTISDIATISIAFGSAAAGALLGSLSAFYLGYLQQRSDKTESRHAALLQTQYALMSQWNILEGIRRSLLEPHRKEPGRAHKMPVFYAFGRHASVPFQDISFISNSDDPNLLQEIHLAEQGYETALEALRVRNTKIEEFYASSDVKILEFDVNTGKSRVEASAKDIFFVSRTTDNLFDMVDHALPKLVGEIQCLEDFIKRNFKGRRALKMAEKV